MRLIKLAIGKCQIFSIVKIMPNVFYCMQKITKKSNMTSKLPLKLFVLLLLCVFFSNVFRNRIPDVNFFTLMLCFVHLPTHAREKLLVTQTENEMINIRGASVSLSYLSVAYSKRRSGIFFDPTLPHPLRHTSSSPLPSLT